MRYLFLLSFLGLLVSCSSTSEEKSSVNKKTKSVALKKVQELTSIADTLFFAQIFDIEIIDDQYYFADYGQERIYIFDKNWNIRKFFGRYGQGPSEFDGLSRIVFNSSLIGIPDIGSVSIKLFDKSHRYIKSIRLPQLIDAYTEFSLDSANNFYQHSGRYDLINKYDTAGVITDTYGNFEKDFTLSTKGRINFQTNQWHVVIHKQNLFAVNVCEPIIISYDIKTKEKTGSYNLSELEVLQNRLKFTEKSIQADPYVKSAYNLFSDVIFRRDEVFLLYINHDEVNDKVLSNQILHLKLIDDSSFREVAVYQLNPKGWYETFTIDGNRLITFDSYASAIEEYQIE